MFSVSYGLNDRKFVFFFKISSYHSNICRVLYQAKTNSCCSCYCWHNLCNRKVCTWRERLQITWWNLQLYGVYTCAQLLNCAWLFDPMDCIPQAPLSIKFSQQEYWSGLPFPPPGDHPDPGIKLTSPACPAWAGGFFTTRAICEENTSTCISF